MEKLRRIKELLENKKAENIVVLDVSNLTNISDFFVIATANSTVHAKALADYLVEEMEKAGYQVDHVEGTEFGNWILIDLLDVIVHIFTPEWRDHYGIEWIWSEARKVEV
ncbi:ribosome silencing factor [Hydrogenivirga sp.]